MDSTDTGDTAEFRQHVRDLLHDYLQSYCLVDHINHTEDLVYQFLCSLKPVSLIDTHCFSRPIEPFEPWAKKAGLDTLPVFNERIHATKDALHYVRSATIVGQSHDDTYVKKDDYGQNLCKDDWEPILTRQAREQTPRLGKLHSPLTLATLQSKLKTVDVEDVKQPVIDIDLTLNNKLSHRDQDQADLHHLVKLLKVKPAEGSRHLDPDFLRDVPLPNITFDDEPFTPLFCRRRNRGSGKSSTRQPRNHKDLVRHLAPVDPPSDPDIVGHHVATVDGWEAYISSSPAPSLANDSDEDQLNYIRLSSSPTTEPLAEVIEKAQMLMPLVPQSKRIGGRFGVQKHILADKSLGTFLQPLLPTIETLDDEDVPLRLSPIPASSVLGHAAKSTTNQDVASENYSRATLDVELERIYAPYFLDEEFWCDAPFDEKVDGMMKVPDLLEPNIHPPDERFFVPRSLTNFLVHTPPGPKTTEALKSTNSNLKTGACPHQFLRKTHGIASLAVALSWVPFTTTEKLPGIIEVVDLPLPFDETPDCSVKEEIGTLLRYATNFDLCFLSEALFAMNVIPSRGFEMVSTVDALLGNDAPLPVLSWSLGSAELDFPVEHPDDVLGSAWSLPIILRRREKGDTSDTIPDGNMVDLATDDADSAGNSPQRLVKRPRVFPQLDEGVFLDMCVGGIPTENAGSFQLGDDALSFVQAGMDVMDFDLNLDADEENMDPSFHSQTAKQDYIDLDADKENVDPSGLMDVVDQEVHDEVEIVGLPQYVADIGQPHAIPLATGLRLNPSCSLFLAPEIGLRSLALENFGRLRGRSFARNETETELRSSSPSFAPPEAEANMHLDDETTATQIQTTPPSLIDPKTLVLPGEIALPSRAHRYLASLETIQRHALVSCLNARECAVDLIERETLGGAHLVLDPFTAVLLVPVFVLPARSDDFVKAVAGQTWKYERLLILFEAYPEEEGRKVGLIAAGRAAEETDGKMRPRRLRLHAYTPPVMKAIGRFRRGVEIAMACSGGKSTTTIQYAFANTVEEAAIFVRYYGSIVEEALKEQSNDGGAVLGTWGDREWLVESNWDEEDEANLALAQGMNPFSACVVLCMMPLQDFVDLTPEERLDGFGPYLGVDAMLEFNAYLEAQVQAQKELLDDTTVAMDASH